jgi:tight adherence protein B
VSRAALLAVAVIVLALPATAVGSGSTQVRHIDFSAFPLVRVTALAPAGARPALFENGSGAEFVHMRLLGSAEAMMLAVDNSNSMQGGPLREAKRAAGEFLTQERRAGAVGLVAFGHEALPLTRSSESRSDVIQTMSALAVDQQVGTALYDAVELSVSRLKRMSTGQRILVLLTDGQDVGSHASLASALADAQKANVVVYAIAAGRRADKTTLEKLVGPTGGRVFGAADVTQLAAVYQTLGQELDRTWQISYLSKARPGDWITLTLRSGAADYPSRLRVPGSSLSASGPIPNAHSPITALVISVLAGLLLAGAAGTVIQRRRRSEITRLLKPHVRRSEEAAPEAEGTGRSESLLLWIESAMSDLPASQRITNLIDSSGLKLRVGHIPFISIAAAFFLGVIGMIAGTGPGIAILLMLIGLVAPFVVLRVVAHRRTKAFDQQLPDVLAMIASTLRAGHGLRIALRAVADDGTAPASEEFSRVLGEERLGRPLDEAITAMKERIASPDLEYVATAINVQAQAGGSLATLFDTLSETVRERHRHARKVRALTSMGRMSAAILIALPFGLALLMTAISPTYMAPLYKTTAGHVLMVGCVVSMGIGALFLKKIVNVRF